MAEIFTVLLTIAFGAVGYLIATFWVRPILRYKDIKYGIAADLVYYANVIGLKTDVGLPTDEELRRKDANRKRAAELEAIYYELPYWYVWWLRKRKENPVGGSAELIGLSNTSDREGAKDYIRGVREYLHLPLRR
jgi:hypothetical protein